MSKNAVTYNSILCFQVIGFLVFTEDNSNYTRLCTTMHRPDRGNKENRIIRKNPHWKMG